MHGFSNYPIFLPLYHNFALLISSYQFPCFLFLLQVLNESDIWGVLSRVLAPHSHFFIVISVSPSFSFSSVFSKPLSFSRVRISRVALWSNGITAQSLSWTVITLSLSLSLYLTRSLGFSLKTRASLEQKPHGNPFKHRCSPKTEHTVYNIFKCLKHLFGSGLQLLSMQIQTSRHRHWRI